MLGAFLSWLLPFVALVFGRGVPLPSPFASADRRYNMGAMVRGASPLIAGMLSGGDMLTEDKTQAGENYSIDDNVNTRDQRRALIWLIVLSLVSVAFLVALGLQHVTEKHHAEKPADGTNAGPVLPWEVKESVHKPVAAIELPGRISEDQKERNKLMTQGNTPWTAEETDKIGAADKSPPNPTSVEAVAVELKEKEAKEAAAKAAGTKPAEAAPAPAPSAH